MLFLFTDIEGSTQLWQAYPQEMQGILARHDQILAEQIAAHGGRVVKHTGDGVFAVFDGGEPLACALTLQKIFNETDWEPIGALRIRIAMNAGDAEQRANDFFGLEVSRTMRILSAGWGGQILFTPQVLETYALPAHAETLNLGAHRLKDLRELQPVWMLTHPSLPRRDFPPLRSLLAHRSNLPPQPTPFVRRAEELQQTLAHLQNPACHLLTVVGPGGIGKTRLALQLAADAAPFFEDGVFFVPLDPLEVADELPSAIAQQVQLTLVGSQAPTEQLLNFLRAKHLLLVLDNFEHLLTGAALVNEILQTAPQVKIVATSRERLNLRSEWIFQLGGMVYPPHESAPNFEQYDAVRLFVQNALRAAPGFELTPENRAAIVKICRLVNGLPLALELTAAWLRLLSLPEIAEELAHDFDLLSTPYHDVVERHRTLRAVFEYSWNLLDEQEKAALPRLTVFYAPFQLPVARAVCGVGLRQLSALTDKSLLLRTAEYHYYLHPLVRQYAAEKLSEADSHHLHAQHSTTFMQILHTQGARYRSGEQFNALQSIAACFEDIQAAWRWLTAQEDWTALENGLETLKEYCLQRGLGKLGEGLCRPALARLAALGTQPRLQAHLQTAIGLFGIAQNQYSEALSLLQESLAAHRQQADFDGQISALLGLHTIYWVQSQQMLDQQVLAELLTLTQSHGSSQQRAQSLSAVGSMAWISGNYAEAEAYLQQALAIQQANHDHINAANSLDRLGLVERERGNFAEARRLIEQAIAMIETLNLPMHMAFYYNHLASVWIDADPQKSLLFLQKSIDLGREIGHLRVVAYSTADMSEVLIQEKRAAEALAGLDESFALFEQMKDYFGMCHAVTSKAAMYLGLNQTQLAHAALKRAAQLALQVESTMLSLHQIVLYAGILLQMNNSTAAYSLTTFLLNQTEQFRERPQVENLHKELAANLTVDERTTAQTRTQALTIDAILQEIANLPTETAHQN